MRGRNSRGMETNKVDKAKDEPRLSGSYIRSLVKHLTSTKTKHSFNGGSSKVRLPQQESPPRPQPPQHKKQVRRRQHTSRPYQERLLNMAEARREIVTALKFHRASMKQQEVKSSQTHPPPEQPLPPYYWPVSAIAPPPLPSPYHQNLNFTLPNQTLGLNLNLTFQDFKNYHNPYSSSSSSASISAGNPASGGGLHHAMDDKEMEEIRCLGEQHQMEWNDTVNMVTSARWNKFLKTMEDGHYSNSSDQVIEFPPWLINANESCSLHKHLDDCSLQDPSLPCMDIGEIEGMYGEWLA